jgi:hypothetical protein
MIDLLSFYVRRCWRGVSVEVRCSKGLGASYSDEKLTFRSTHQEHKAQAQKKTVGKYPPVRFNVDASRTDAERQEFVKRVAQEFHDTYERLGPLAGYETRRDSAVPWKEVPETNRVLMYATVSSLLEQGIIQ